MKIETCSPETGRQALLLGWFACFVLNLLILLWLYFGDWILQDNFRTGLSQLSSLYAPYLGAILTFYFSSRAKTSPVGATAGTAFVLAAIGSGVLNAVTLILMGRVLFFWGTIEETIRDIVFFGSTLSWLVAPAMGFYFANPSLAAEKRKRDES
jgi:hypothetical protein